MCWPVPVLCPKASWGWNHTSLCGICDMCHAGIPKPRLCLHQQSSSGPGPHCQATACTNLAIPPQSHNHSITRPEPTPQPSLQHQHAQACGRWRSAATSCPVAAPAAGCPSSTCGLGSGRCVAGRGRGCGMTAGRHTRCGAGTGRCRHTCPGCESHSFAPYVYIDMLYYGIYRIHIISDIIYIDRLRGGRAPPAMDVSHTYMACLHTFYTTIWSALETVVAAKCESHLYVCTHASCGCELHTDGVFTSALVLLPTSLLHLSTHACVQPPRCACMCTQV